MIIGGLWQFIGLMIGAFLWYNLILEFSIIIVFIAYPLFSTVFDLFFIPISAILNEGMRKKLNLQYFEDILESTIIRRDFKRK